MAKSGFFKSDWFKCIASLLAIALIACSLLAILNDVLFVSDEERTRRAITKVYEGEEVSDYSVIEDIDNSHSKDNGEIIQLFVVGDKTSSDFDLLFQVVGNKGYHDGTITLWVKVDIEEGVQTIGKVLITDNTKQTLMSKLNDFNLIKNVDITDKFGEEDLFSPKEGTNHYAPVSGATKSATAACNALNCVILYMGNVWGK